MKTPEQINMRKIIKGLMAATALFAAGMLVSCGGTEYKYVDCALILDNVIDLYDDYNDAYASGNCEELVGIMDNIIAEYKKAKVCKDFKALYTSEGFNSASEYLDALEQDAIADTEECENEPS